MKLQNLATNARELSRSFVRSDAPEKNRKNVPTLDEIHRRARELHVERGDHGCDLDNYLDEWLEAERELREKYNRSNGAARSKATQMRGEIGMFSTLSFIDKWKEWYRVLRYH